MAICGVFVFVWHCKRTEMPQAKDAMTAVLSRIKMHSWRAAASQVLWWSWRKLVSRMTENTVL